MALILAISLTHPASSSHISLTRGGLTKAVKQRHQLVEQLIYFKIYKKVKFDSKLVIVFSQNYKLVHNPLFHVASHIFCSYKNPNLSKRFKITWQVSIHAEILSPDLHLQATVQCIVPYYMDICYLRSPTTDWRPIKYGLLISIIATYRISLKQPCYCYKVDQTWTLGIMFVYLYVWPDMQKGVVYTFTSLQVNMKVYMIHLYKPIVKHNFNWP